MRKIKGFFTGIGGRIEGILAGYPFLSCVCLGFFMNILLYIFDACSLFSGLSAIFGGFGYFLFNSLILISFYALSLFFSRRIFVIALVSLIWFALGVINFVLLGMRDSSLEAIDFQIVRTGFAIVTIYLSVFEIVLYSVLAVVAIGLLTLLFIKCPKMRPHYIRALLIFICLMLALSVVGLVIIGTERLDGDDIDSGNVGFAYFFLKSVFDRGIDRPDEYSEQALREVIDNLGPWSASEPARKPNVIFVQLESFFDINRMSNIRFSSDPIPNFTAMCKANASGRFGVESIGSGTANTEFEVLSGLDLNLFGTGEYPYTGILGDVCCETVAYNLSELGYTCHAMHNHTATFYDRHLVYANLGFDSFTAVEHMQGVEYNPIGWECDRVLTDYILGALSSTDGRDFVFAVSVQGHGRYPDIPVYEQPPITVEGAESEERKNQLEFYASQLYEMDAFIGELYERICELDEDTVLVLYGDHLPSADLEAQELEDGRLYESDYVILSNFGLELEDRDIEAFELSPIVLNALGIKNGVINRVHAEYGENENFRDILQLVGFDMIYGERLIYPNGYPYLPKDMKMGLDKIRIAEAQIQVETAVIRGEGFTPFSHVFVNGKREETEFINSSTLAVKGICLEYGDRITVAQISADLRKLSECDEYVYTRGFMD